MGKEREQLWQRGANWTGTSMATRRDAREKRRSSSSSHAATE